jgi:hypothetical protein
MVLVLVVPVANLTVQVLRMVLMVLVVLMVLMVLMVLQPFVCGRTASCTQLVPLVRGPVQPAVRWVSCCTPRAVVVAVTVAVAHPSHPSPLLQHYCRHPPHPTLCGWMQQFRSFQSSMLARI